MNITELTEHLKQINSVKVTAINGSSKVLIENDLKDYNIEIDSEDVDFVDFIDSPMGDECAQVYYTTGSGIIICPNDFVFEVEQDEMVQVGDLPPMCSVTEMIQGFENYKSDPTPSDNIDNNMGLFYLHYYIIKSAVAIGFKVPMINELYDIGKEKGYVVEDLALELFKDNHVPEPTYRESVIEATNYHTIKDLIYLQDILPLDELSKNGQVLLIRHSPDYLDYLIKRNLVEIYQQFQNKPAFLKAKYIISFIAGERNSGILYGVYEITNILRKENLPIYPKELETYCHPLDPVSDFYMELKRITEFDKYKDRIVIDWIVPRGWYNNYGDVKDKVVIKLLPKNFVQDFPGMDNVRLSFNELKVIIENPESNADWFNALSRLQAVYLILYTKSGLQYIGTTYGENGLWQRWETYVKTHGTGGNIELINLKKQDPEFYHYLQFSILEVLSKTADQKYCSGKESLWKEKLGSRVSGLNKN